jgi:enediyne biosynthesis protein E3
MVVSAHWQCSRIFLLGIAQTASYVDPAFAPSGFLGRDLSGPPTQPCDFLPPALGTGGTLMLSPRWFRRRLFGIPPKEWTFDRRGFPDADPVKRQHLERIIRTFVDGYHATLDDSRHEILCPKLAGLEPEFRGFAFEGVALCLAAFDRLTPWKRNRWQTFRDGPGEPQSFLMHVGYGLALAQLGRPADEALGRLSDPGERWLAIDGYGFHQGYFRWQHFVNELADPGKLSGFSRRCFDMGLGRCLWFGCGADIERVTQTLATFPTARHADLWSGLGVASTFAGGVTEGELRALRDLAGSFEPHLQQGAVFATKLRHRAGTVVSHTELACQTLCGMSAGDAVAMVDAAFEGLPPDGDLPSYEILRQRVQHQFAHSSRQELPT